MNTRFPLPCPFCGTDDFGLARHCGPNYMVGCESEDCRVNPQVMGATPALAWAAWNTRPPVGMAEWRSDEELAGAGGMK